MQCIVFKSLQKKDTYLYTLQAFDKADLPEDLARMMGDLEQVIEIDLARRERLASVDIEKLKVQLKEKGYYLQLPLSQHPLDQDFLEL